MKNKEHFLSGFIGGLFCFCLFIILWGAFVRISHSGDGCGPHWPLCQGEYFVNQDSTSKTWIEWTHRATSGLFGLLVLLLYGACWIPALRRTKIAVRKSAFWVLIFTITEALLGARLVLAGLTGSNSSLARAMTMNLHLLNSLLLSASLFICWRISLGHIYRWPRICKKQTIAVVLLFFILAGLGSFSALSSSLFPSSSLWEGLAEDFQPESNYLIRLRLWHPMLALLLGALLYGFWTYRAQKRAKNGAQKKTNSPLILVCFGLAWLSGLLNLVLLSPVVLKLTHLLAVYLLGMSFLLSLETRARKL